MVVLVLVVVWMAVLIPVALRKRDEWSFGISLQRFRQRNRALSTTRPRLAAVPAIDDLTDEEQRRARARQLRAERQRIARRRAQRRRVLRTLLLGFAGLLLLGAIPPLRALWDLAVVDVIITACYAALCARAAQDEAQSLVVARGAATIPAGGGVVVPLRPAAPAFVIVEATS